jgi:hypothetical protein
MKDDAVRPYADMGYMGYTTSAIARSESDRNLPNWLADGLSDTCLNDLIV